MKKHPSISKKALVFDMDGVFVDTEPLHHRSFIDVFKPLGININLDYSIMNISINFGLRGVSNLVSLKANDLIVWRGTYNFLKIRILTLSNSCLLMVCGLSGIMSG